MNNRTYNTDRAAQGFRSQTHLDAFYMYYDHTKTCADCGAGQAVFIDDSWQSTFAPCPIARQLDNAAR